MVRRGRRQAKRQGPGGWQAGPPRPRQAPAESAAETARRCGSILARDPANSHAAAALASLTGAARAEACAAAARLAGTGDAAGALAVLQPLARAHPGDVAANAMAMRALAVTGRAAAALPLGDAALALNPGAPELRAAQGVALYRLGRFAEAEPALAAGPGDADTLNLLGRCREVLGDLAGAEVALRRAAALPGAAGQVWHNLAAHVDFARDTACYEALQAARAATPPAGRLLFDLALSKAEGDRGADEESFALLARANAAIAAARPAGMLAARRAKIAAAAELPARLCPVPAPAEAPRAVLILGMPRSGTSLAEQILARHPGVAAGGETDALERAVTPLFSASGPGASAQMATSYRAALRRLAGEHGTVTDKMPANAYLAGAALVALPEARAIWMRRHPMATGFSCFRTHFGQGQAWSYRLEEIAAEFRATEAAMARWQAAFPDRVLEVVLERLAADPQAEIARMLEFCGLDPDPACFAADESGAALHTASALAARGPVRPREEVWRRHAARLAPLAALLEEEIRAHEARLCKTRKAAAERP
ncbi:sulfotransferase [Poseidonocella sp. HB161398]|uniref:tetratricopeptide repeat-containing sulfotransferase family protein n=1 Tax=Poseidonocella sp. HB161398 TaxID=2320855 RepID=UPI001107B5F8|nr:sulfotransferase [Poseidonocella sp. HB161398]